MNNDYNQDNNYPAPQQQWNQQAPPPYNNEYGYMRMRSYEEEKKSPITIFLISIIAILLVAICLLGGFLLGRGKPKDNEPQNESIVAEVTEPPTATPTTEAPETQPQTVIVTVTVTEVQVSIVTVVVTEPPKPKSVDPPAVYQCDVRVNTQTTDLNMRDSASMGGNIIGSIPKGTVIPYYGSVGNWGVVKYNGIYGYVSMDYIVAASSYSSNSRSGYIGYGTVTANDGLNIRSSATTNSSILTTLKHGASLDIISVTGSWYYITASGYTGYVSSEYVNAYFY